MQQYYMLHANVALYRQTANCKTILVALALFIW